MGCAQRVTALQAGRAECVFLRRSTSRLLCRYIGVDHVFIYDNNEDGGKQAQDVQDFIDDEFVTWQLVKGPAFSGMQDRAYQHCLSTYGPYVSWLAAIDTDEYLSVEDAAARQLPPARRLKAVLGNFRFMPGMPWSRIVHASAKASRFVSLQICLQH